MRENITLRITKRSEPLFDKVEEIAKTQSTGNDKFTPTLLNIIELGIKSYESGNRVIDGEVFKKPSVYETGERTTYSVYNEVIETLYSSLTGSLTDLARNESEKKAPNQDLINYYKLVRRALWLEKSNFSTLTDNEIIEVEKQLSPINKQITGVDYEKDQQVIENYRAYFDGLISKSGIAK